jgi:CsoR family transcriptional regulator, copper-sensing transcriptional repressor
MDHCTCESRNAVVNLKTARGQIDGIIKMIEDDRYCIDVSKQILAVIALLRKSNSTVLRQHMNTCVADALAAGDASEKLDEIMRIVDSYIV